MSSFAPGAVIDGFEIVGLLGRGGMGAVFRVRRGEQELALKTITGQLSAEELIRFDREAQLLARLRHPSIVPIHTAGQANGVRYFAMGLVEGESLEARLRRGPLDAREAARVVGQVAGAVAFAHAKGVVHRDLKPANVLLEKDTGRALVADFGLARDMGDEQERLTRTGEILGTPAYMAPEQAMGRTKQLDERTDVYALGAILYASLSGRPPFEGKTALETIKAVRDQAPLPLEGVSPALESLVLRSLSKNRLERPPTAEAFGAELAQALEAGAGVSRRLLHGLLGTAALCAVGTLALAWHSRPGKRAAGKGAEGASFAALEAAEKRLGTAVEGYPRGREDALREAHQALAGLPAGERAKAALWLEGQADAAFVSSDWSHAAAAQEILLWGFERSAVPERAEVERARLAVAVLAAAQGGSVSQETLRQLGKAPAEALARPPLAVACERLFADALGADGTVRLNRLGDLVDAGVPAAEAQRAGAARVFVEAAKKVTEGDLDNDKERNVARMEELGRLLGRAHAVDPAVAVFPEGLEPAFRVIVLASLSQSDGGVAVSPDRVKTAFAGWREHPIVKMLDAHREMQVAMTLDPRSEELVSARARILAQARATFEVLAPRDRQSVMGRELAVAFAKYILLPLFPEPHQQREAGVHWARGDRATLVEIEELAKIAGYDQGWQVLAQAREQVGDPAGAEEARRRAQAAGAH